MTAHRDLTWAAALAVLAAALCLAPLGFLRIIGGVPLTLVLPGYAITMAAFASWGIARSRLLILSLGLSLATLAVGVLLLNYVPGGITRLSWTVLLLLVVLVGCAVAAQRRPAPSTPLALRLPRPGIPDGALLLGAIVIAGLAFGLAFTVLPAKKAIGYTQLSMLPGPGAKVASVRIEVVSQEQHAGNYRLEVEPADGSKPIVSSFALKPGQGRGFQFKIRRPNPGRSVRVKALLFQRAHPDTVYRRVTGWIPGA